MEGGGQGGDVNFQQDRRQLGKRSATQRQGAASMSKIAEHDSKMDGICQQEGGTSAKVAAHICQRAAPTNNMGDSCREGGTY